jgi:hypothetical protein
LSVSKRTMRPRRASVFWAAGEILARDLVSLLMVGIMREERGKW